MYSDVKSMNPTELNQLAARLKSDSNFASLFVAMGCSRAILSGYDWMEYAQALALAFSSFDTTSGQRDCRGKPQSTAVCDQPRSHPYLFTLDSLEKQATAREPQQP
ncbi:hypothetical protein BJ322DRAFT_1207963 [Thelephora terrestris]|uniref:Uncharacterized protein n=1 Tax=Thelephora terrestris TaxID=56493 RepID=A0A9P6HLT4_9AGAM|nr:hypothetical protein BJ322DRAFT_1207963 [Thelephora terrestris]